MKYLVTRALEDSLELKARLEKKGDEVFCLPLIEIKPPSDGGALKEALSRLAEYDWLVVTSRNGAEILKTHITQWPAGLKIAAGGPGTAKVLKELGCSPYFPQQDFGAKGLIRFFQGQDISGKKILYPRSSIGRKELVEALEGMGARVDVVEAYRTERTFVTAPDIFSLLNKGIEAVLFFSPSAVHHFFDLIRPTDERIRHLVWVPIGSTTANALKQAQGGEEAD